VSKEKAYKKISSQMIDPKEHVFGCSGRARVEMAALKKEKRVHGSGAPNRVFCRVNCAKG
jgi:hypothetical protein